LKDIPGLGFLFRSQSDKNDRSEIIVFIRPTILPTPQDAARMAKTETDRLPGIRIAEQQNNADEEKRLKKAETKLKKKK
jgi:type II secretory pathway component GspD/PulD (secretin)